MIIKLTATGKNEATYINFDYVHTMRRDGAFTELVMSDDRYHKLAVTETPEEIYEMLYPTKHCHGNCSCNTVENEIVSQEVATVENKKPAVKKTSAKPAETN